MSEEGEFEVRGSHEDVLEERAKEENLAQKVALLTAILSAIGAIFSYNSGHTQTEASFLKNSSIAKQTQAGDQWAYYQAKSTREYVAHLAARQTPDPAMRGEFAAEATRFGNEKEEIKAQAEKFEQEAAKLSEDAERILKPHHQLSLAMTMIQIAITLSSLTVLTRKRWLLVTSFAAAGAALVTALAGIIS
jgi:hypothetical protein